CPRSSPDRSRRRRLCSRSRSALESAAGSRGRPPHTRRSLLAGSPRFRPRSTDASRRIRTPSSSRRLSHLCYRRFPPSGRMVNNAPMTTHLEVAERFFGAIERGDIDTVRNCYAPNAVIWHNFDGVEQTRDQNLRTLGWLSKALPKRKYEV